LEAETRIKAIIKIKIKIRIKAVIKADIKRGIKGETRAETREETSRRVAGYLVASCRLARTQVSTLVGQIICPNRVQF
jgi:hypothetical protein